MKLVAAAHKVASGTSRQFAATQIGRPEKPRPPTGAYPSQIFGINCRPDVAPRRMTRPPVATAMVCRALQTPIVATPFFLDLRAFSHLRWTKQKHRISTSTLALIQYLSQLLRMLESGDGRFAPQA